MTPPTAGYAGAPRLIRKLILASTGPSAREGLDSGPQEIFMDFMNAESMEENEKTHRHGFFTSNSGKQSREKNGGYAYILILHPVFKMGRVLGSRSNKKAA
jgi:hypothetical protein